MFDHVDEISRQLRAGEDSRAEFKEVRTAGGRVLAPEPDDLAGELVALANAEGGAIFLGVGDDGIIRGIPSEDLDGVEQWAINIASNNCEPAIRPILRKELLPTSDDTEVRIIMLEVRRSLYVHRTSGGRYLVRVGSTKRDLTPQELARLFQQRAYALVFDEQVVPTASTTDLDEKLVKEFLGSPRLIDLHQVMLNKHMLARDSDGALRPSVGGLLAFGTDPRLNLPSAHIEAAVYRGVDRDSDDLVHSEAIGGPIAQQIDGAVAFVNRFMLKPARKPVGREDYPQYAIGAVHEAVVNAVAHRDYSIVGSKIRLFLFDDRLELYSPGGLPNTVTLETMADRQFTRNQLLVSFLSRMRSRESRAYIEERGEGVHRILRDSEEHSGRKPEYRLIGDYPGQELLLTIWAKRPPE